MLHARLQPALGDCKEPGGFARGKGFVKTEHTAIAAVALGTIDREGGAAAAEVGQAAIRALHGMSVDGRSIGVNLARPREEGGGSGGYSAAGYTAGKRSDVGYGTGGYGGGRY